MKQEVQFLVTRLDGKVEDVQPLNEIYDHVQITLDKQYLTEEDILKFYSHMARSYQLRRLADVLDSGLLRDEQEAKDLICDLSRYSIQIEKKEIEFV